MVTVVLLLPPLSAGTVFSPFDLEWIKENGWIENKIDILLQTNYCNLNVHPFNLHISLSGGPCIRQQAGFDTGNYIFFKMWWMSESIITAVFHIKLSICRCNKVWDNRKVLYGQIWLHWYFCPTQCEHTHYCCYSFSFICFYYICVEVCENKNMWHK